ncbi:hypothetical protein EELLY_v1c01240 [Entomoplasma ellychniae]|uniref:Uncharacterized protein n=1 Tax=Entomoplasma ellychniae TaxID=2114 RepID=A0A8E2QY71_9MOLU|nr:hypothetical protein [Entomoplasma ellychniae]PPE04449.1 hypothetical protein EELLY_v1c01240 [Entomoplasma ellychniae]
MHASILKEITKKYIKSFDLRNSLGIQRVYTYDKKNIEKEIYSFLNSELNEKESGEYDFDNEVSFVKDYLNIDSINYDDNFKNEISKLYLRKIEMSEDKEKHFLSNYAWPKFEQSVKDETDPFVFSQSINGYSEVYSFTDDILLIGIWFIIAAVISFTVSATLGSGGLLAPAIPLVAVGLTKIGLTISEKVVKLLIKKVITKAVKKPLKKTSRFSYKNNLKFYKFTTYFR